MTRLDDGWAMLVTCGCPYWRGLIYFLPALTFNDGRQYLRLCFIFTLNCFYSFEKSNFSLGTSSHKSGFF